MKKIFGSLFTSFALVAGVQAADASVKISEVHLCCKSCVDGVHKAVAEIKGLTADINSDEEIVSLTGPDKATLQKAADALVAIDAWPWPGNVRELENRVKRAVIMADGKLVSAGDLDLGDPDGAEAAALNLKAAREQTDRRMIRHALARSEGNISSTAKLLGISRPTLYDLLKQYDLHA